MLVYLGVSSLISQDPSNQLLYDVVNDFLAVTIGILVEAMPFLVLGVIASVVVDLFVSADTFIRLIPKNRFLSHIFISLFGVFMPVCECGNVPVARRFLMRGLSVSHATTFLLAAPIVNPLTLWSTMEAFRLDPSVAVIRVIAAFLIANFIGLLFTFKEDQSELLTDSFASEVEECLIEDHHHHDHSKLQHALGVFRDEFVSTLNLLLFGAVIAAATQTFLPRSLIEGIGNSPLLSVLAMLLLAFIISICANVDAFFALAYAGTFTMGSIITFLVFGPMIDVKVLSMLRRTFKPTYLILLTVLVALLSILTGLIVNYLI